MLARSHTMLARSLTRSLARSPSSLPLFPSLPRARALSQRVMEDPGTLAQFARKARDWGVVAGSPATEAVVWVFGLAVVSCVVDAIERMPANPGQ